MVREVREKSEQCVITEMKRVSPEEEDPGQCCLAGAGLTHCTPLDLTAVRTIVIDQRQQPDCGGS